VCFLLIDIDTRVPAARCCQAIAIKTSAACDACYNENPLNQIMRATSRPLGHPPGISPDLTGYTERSGKSQGWVGGRSTLSGTFITQQILPDSAQINCSSFHIGFWLFGNKQQTDSTIKIAAKSFSSYAADCARRYIVGGKYKWIWMAFHSGKTWIYYNHSWKIIRGQVFVNTICCNSDWEI